MNNTDLENWAGKVARRRGQLSLCSAVFWGCSIAEAAEVSELSRFSMGDFKDVATGMAALIGAIVAIYGVRNGLRSARRALEEKQKENRQRQLSASRDALKDIFDDPLARAAMQMMDWSGRTFIHDSQVYQVFWQELKPALVNHITRDGFTPQQEFIRDSFETLFDHMQLLAHFIENEYLNEADIAVPLKYYADRVVAYPETYDPFLLAYGYDEARKLMIRLAAWA
jgi:hypothetical protein